MSTRSTLPIGMIVVNHACRSKKQPIRVRWVSQRVIVSIANNVLRSVQRASIFAKAQRLAAFNVASALMPAMT